MRISGSLLCSEDDLVMDEVLIVAEVQIELRCMTHPIKGTVMTVKSLGQGKAEAVYNMGTGIILFIRLNLCQLGLNPYHSTSCSSRIARCQQPYH